MVSNRSLGEGTPGSNILLISSSTDEKLKLIITPNYEELAEKSTENKETFLAFAKESRKNKVLVTRTYQETITDALEACFIQINLGDYLTEPPSREGLKYLDALRMAIGLEEKASKFYLDITERSESLLATIPMAFRKVAERRNNRKLKLRLLLDKLRAREKQSGTAIALF